MMNININYLQVLTAYLGAVHSLPQISKHHLYNRPKRIRASTLDIMFTRISSANLSSFFFFFFSQTTLLREKNQTNKQAFPPRLQGSQGRWVCKRSTATPGRNWHFCWDCARNNAAGLGQEQPVLSLNRVTNRSWQRTSSNCSSAAGHLAGLTERGSASLRGRNRLSPRAFVFRSSAINPSQLHKSANINSWGELCKHDTCNWSFGENLPSCSPPSTADFFFKSCLRAARSTKRAFQRAKNQQPVGAYYFMAIQTFAMGFQMSLVSGFCT